MTTSIPFLLQEVVQYYLHGDDSGEGYVENRMFQKGRGAGIGGMIINGLKKLGKYALKKVVGIASGAASDAIKGKNIGRSLKDRSAAAVENLGFETQQLIPDEPSAGKRKKNLRKRQPARRKTRRVGQYRRIGGHGNLDI